ncbi:MAG: SMP-30/gluconolactonase/LRE family protein [Pseudomonadota bacterium]
MSKLECIWQAKAILGEAPLWQAEQQCLYWVDMDGKKILRWNFQDREQKDVPIAHEIGCLAPRQKGGFVAGLENGLAFVDQDLKDLKTFASPEGDLADTRFNDGKCDPRGRFWVGSTDRQEVNPIGALYMVTPDHQVHKKVSGVTVSNGLDWSPHGTTMYFTDSGAGAIYAYDFDLETGDLQGRRTFAQVDPAEGLPDGLTVDGEGYIWSARWDGWQICRYAPDGKVDRIIRLPVPRVTSMAFGGPNLDQLFITTARLGMTQDELREAPLSGSLFVMEPGVTGLPAWSFKG